MSSTSPLLDHDLFSTATGQVSLPGLLTELGAGRPTRLLYLRPFQEHAVYAFLVQLAALGVHKTGGDADDPKLDRSADTWRDTLLALAPEPAWTLVVDDLSQPAFMQTPVPEGSLAGYKNSERFPDQIDVLATAKNHDVKWSRIGHPRAEHWVYALISLQTMQGFSGRDNYGISRMNGGFASRPHVGLVPDVAWHTRFARDVGLWLERRRHLVETHGFRDEAEAPALLWTLPWDGSKKSSRSLHSVDPFFVEVCRRIRLTINGDGTIVAHTASTKAAFLDAKETAGVTGDLWTPTKLDKDGTPMTALTISGAGFHYTLVAKLLQQRLFAPSPAMHRDEPDEEVAPDSYLFAQALARGQGKTDGYHERTIPIDRDVMIKLDDEETVAYLGELASRQVDLADIARRRVLHPALCVLLQGAPDEKLDLRDKRTQPWVDALDREIDRTFFEALWEALKLYRGGDHQEDAENQWKKHLAKLAEEQFEKAIGALPIPDARRYRAIAVAQRAFYGAVRNKLAWPRERATNEETAA